MPAPKLTDEQCYQALLALEKHGGQNKAADALGMDRSTFLHRVQQARARPAVMRLFAGREKGTPAPEPQPLRYDKIQMPEIPSELQPVSDLIKERIKKFKHRQAHEEARRLVRIKVPIDGPIALSHFGDPHIDDDGTDIERLVNDVGVIKRTEGMYACNCGDTNNNWIGRLARLWEHQSTSGPEAWQLVEWFIKEVDWLVIIGGNHGAWSGTGDPLNWIVSHCKTLFDNHGARIALEFPNGREVRLNARHDFSGHSMWNPAHGPMKAAKMGWRDHILTCGHTHVSGVGMDKDPSSGLISHMFRIASYKTYDRYGHEKGLPDQNIFSNVVTIIDPSLPDNDPRLIRAHFNDVEYAADHLTWLRNRK